MVPGQVMGVQWEDRLVRGPVAVCVVGKYRRAGGVVDGGYRRGSLVVMPGTGERVSGLGRGPRR
jgi:hypothetical protein